MEPLGGDFDGPSSAAVSGLPLAALEPILRLVEAALAEVAAGCGHRADARDHAVELGVGPFDSDTRSPGR